MQNLSSFTATPPLNTRDVPQVLSVALNGAQAGACSSSAAHCVQTWETWKDSQASHSLVAPGSSISKRQRTVGDPLRHDFSKVQQCSDHCALESTCAARRPRHQQ